MYIYRERRVSILGPMSFALFVSGPFTHRILFMNVVGAEIVFQCCSVFQTELLASLDLFIYG